jgi:hypothetical protein
MIRPCSSIGRLYEVTSGSALPLTSETIVNSGTRVLLSSFSFTSRISTTGNYYGVNTTYSPNYYSNLPRVTFRNGDNSIVFGSVASTGPQLYNLGGADGEVGSSTNIPGRGIIFDGLIITVEDEAITFLPGSITYGLNVIYQV